MHQNFKYPKWQEPVAAAILEFNSQQFLAKIQKAEEAIAGRLQELTSEENSQEERCLLYDTISILRGVKHDRLGFLRPET
jgi:hypothetical protein